MAVISILPRILRGLLVFLLFATIIVCLAATIVPPFLDARYYRGDDSAHYDGERFFNPDGEDTAAPPTGGSRGAFLLRYMTGQDGRPGWPATVAVKRMPVAPRIAGKAMVATWVGHATMLVQTRGLNILTDPIWSETAGPLGFGPVRVAEPGIGFDDLPKIDLILVSHNHYDHMDLATLKRLWDRDRPLIVTSLGNDSVIRQAGIPARALDWGGRVVVRPGIEAIVTRNHHWTSRWFTDRNRSLWSSFVVTLPGGNLFFAGDTGAGDYRWTDEARAFGPIRLAILPIGAFRFEEGQMGTGSHVGPIDSVELYRRLGATSAIAVHWGTFRLSYEAYDTPPKMLAMVASCTGIAGFGAAAIGRPVSVPPYAGRAIRPAMPRRAIDDCLRKRGVDALK